MKKHSSTVLSFLAVALMLSYIFYQFFLHSGPSITTELAISYTSSETMSVNALIIRDETVVYDDYSGTLSYSVTDGSHVANGENIATVYSNKEDVETKNRISELEKQIANLQSYSAVGNQTVTDLDSVDTQIDEQLYNVLNLVERGAMLGSIDEEDEYVRLLYRREATVGSTGEFDQQISALTSELKKLENSMNGAENYIKSPSAGYFVSFIDGYENTLNTDIVDQITVESFSELQPEEITNQDNVIGKIVDSFNWYIATEMDFEDSLTFSVGDVYSMDIPVSSNREVPIKVKKIVKDTSHKKAIVIFECTYMDSGLASARSQPVKIILHKYEGLRVPTSAVREVDGVQGVYVLEANLVKFKPIEKIYVGNGYLICKRAQSASEGLYLYDDVIVKGKDLYDGKAITN